MSSGWWRGISLALAVLLLDVSLTFHNIWPTPAITWRGEISVELGAYLCLVALVGAARRRTAPFSRRMLRILAAVWLLFVIGRYADVTATALFGRDINLYWDLRFIPDVVSLLANAVKVRLIVLVIGGILVALGVLYALVRWAVGRVATAGADDGERPIVGVIGLVLVALYVGRLYEPRLEAIPFAKPVTATYGRQVRVAVRALSGSNAVAASPPMNSSLSRVKGADVLLVFLESYGAVTFDRPAFAERLAVARAKLDAAIYETNRRVVSGFVESPTFGGSSWLAHISLMSGVEVRDPDTNALLMAQKRDTIVTTFKRAGYRTIALMPGLWQSWPEGAFYGFDEIYGGARLEYLGPPFGWFDIPDQFALAKFDAEEANVAPRAPIFMFFPTISTHTPFRPTPPYQPDWPRMLTDRPFDQGDLDRAFDTQADWLDLGPSYVDAMTYTYATLTGYLRANADRDLVMIVLGDHQPPALVSGEGAPWDVPVHVITSRRAVLDRLEIYGFREGLSPKRPVVGRMHRLLSVLLDAF
jgi:sulfatase-like protein